MQIYSKLLDAFFIGNTLLHCPKRTQAHQITSTTIRKQCMWKKRDPLWQEECTAGAACHFMFWRTWLLSDYRIDFFQKKLCSFFFTSWLTEGNRLNLLNLHTLSRAGNLPWPASRSDHYKSGHNVTIPFPFSIQYYILSIMTPIPRVPSHELYCTVQYLQTFGWMLWFETIIIHSIYLSLDGLEMSTINS